MMNSILQLSTDQQIIEHLSQAGIPLPVDHIIKYNEMTPYQTKGDKYKKCWYKLLVKSKERYGTLSYGCHQRGIKDKAQIDCGSYQSLIPSKPDHNNIDQLKSKTIKEYYEQALKQAKQDNYQQHISQHPYLIQSNKKLEQQNIVLTLPNNLYRFNCNVGKKKQDCLVTFLFPFATYWQNLHLKQPQAIERIYNDDKGEIQKRALCPKKHAVSIFGDFKNTKTVYITEGVKDSLVAHQLTGQSSMCVYGKNNYSDIAKIAKKVYLNKTFIIIADTDDTEKAKQASKQYGIGCIVPPFTDKELKLGHKDLFDYLVVRGEKKSKAWLESVSKLIPNEKENSSINETWDKINQIKIWIQSTSEKGKAKLRQAKDVIRDMADYLDYEIDTDDNCYAVVCKNGLKSTYDMSDIKFTKFLEDMLRALEKKEGTKIYEGFSPQQWGKLVTIFNREARATVSDQKKAFVRFGWYDGNYYIDLANGKGEVIAITEKGVDIITNPPILFIRVDNQKPINMTKEDIEKVSISDIDLVFKHVNIKPELRPLYIMFLLSCMTEPPYSIAYFTGAKGSGKSTATFVLRDLIDPSKTSMTNFQKDLLGLINTIKSNGVLLYDNIQKIEQKDQDIFCKLTFSKGFCLHDRGLYKEYSITTSKHTPVIINAVFQNTLNTDFSDRCLFFEISKLTAEQIAMDDKLWFKNYEEDRSKIRVALLKLLAEYVKAKYKKTDKVITKACHQFQSKKRLRNDIKMMTMIEVMLSMKNDSTKTLDKIGTTYNAYEKAMNESLREQLRRNPFMSWLVDEIKEGKTIIKGHEYTAKELVEKCPYGCFDMNVSNRRKGQKIASYFIFYADHLEIEGITCEDDKKTKGKVYKFSIVS